MKLSFRYGVSFFFLLSIISFSNTSARFLHMTKPGEKTIMKVDESINTIQVPLADLQTSNSFNEVMDSMEDCESGDKECLKRRVLAVADAEAHLDYIYTQHHKP